MEPKVIVITVHAQLIILKKRSWRWLWVKKDEFPCEDVSSASNSADTVVLPNEPVQQWRQNMIQPLSAPPEETKPPVAPLPTPPVLSNPSHSSSFGESAPFPGPSTAPPTHPDASPSMPPK